MNFLINVRVGNLYFLMSHTHRLLTIYANPIKPVESSESKIYDLLLYIAVMTWCFYLIGTHPEVEEKMYQEIMDVLGEDGEPTFENHRQLV